MKDTLIRKTRKLLSGWRAGSTGAGRRAAVPVAGMSAAALLVLATVALPASAQETKPQTSAPAPPRMGPQGPMVASPEVLPDRRIVFRINAPEAKTVGLVASDIPSWSREKPVFAKNKEGVWESTVGPVDPGAYRYTFLVDGVMVMDPRNPDVSESNANSWSLVYVPGAAFMDTQSAPHGAVASVVYYSTALGRFRRMHIYTPPGYEKDNAKYPVFYLLHGALDCDDSWSSVGRAGFILDNLIAERKAVPMIVVMPAGHTSRTFGIPRPGARDEFGEDFVTDIMPYVESHYRVIADRAHRAMAGLSMGGMQTLNVAMSHLDEFGYLGVFSSGLFTPGAGRTGVASGTPGPPPEWEQQHPMLDNAALKPGLKVFWFSTGSEDFVLPTTKATIEMFRKHGFSPSFQESPGGHSWINWRNYLEQFAPLLFQGSE